MLETIVDKVISGVRAFNSQLKEAQKNAASPQKKDESKTQVDEGSSNNNETNSSSDEARENLVKNFSKDEDTSDEFIRSKEQSMKDSQGVSDFSGSAYNGPGNVDREKVNSNMSQRNY